MHSDQEFENSPPTQERGELNPPPRKPPTAVGAATPRRPPRPRRVPLTPMGALALGKIVAMGLGLLALGASLALASSHPALIIEGIVFVLVGLVLSYFSLFWRSAFLFGGRTGWHVLRTRFLPDLRTAFRGRFGTRLTTRRSPPA